MVLVEQEFTDVVVHYSHSNCEDSNVIQKNNNSDRTEFQGVDWGLPNEKGSCLKDWKFES